MSLFQNSVVTKQLQSQDKSKLLDGWNTFKKHFHNPTIQDNIRSSKEEQYQGEFLIDLFVNVLGYTKNPTPNFTLTTEYKNVKDSKKADGAILISDKVKAVIELKGTNTTDLNKIEVQAFGYKNNQPDCVYVITSNFEKLRFYIDNATEHIEFNLFNLTEKEFELLYLCLAYENIANDIPKKLKEQSLSKEKDITKALYTDYSLFKRELHQDLVHQNPDYDALELFQKSQKLLDRFLFIFFAEDRNLLPTNLIFRINQEWRQLQEMRMNISLYDRYKIYFNDLNQGAKVILPAFSQTMSSQKEEHQIFAYNGGLFKLDTVLDSIKIDDELLYKHTQKLSNFDFQTEVDVNILGHIFENSLNELDEIKNQLEGGSIDKANTKRKKDGVFYTPKYITKYIVDNTVGKLCIDKKAELKIIEEDYFTDKKRTKATKQSLLEKLNSYRNWLLQITICDPACGSGAFLNQALDFLIAEHGYIDELQAKLFGDGLILSDVEKSILENNLFGVDLNEESVEIAKLSLWLRTAQPNRKLNDLNSNIKCGNSLIDDVTIAGDKAFNWQTEFSRVFEKGGFDIIIGNPPYGAKLTIEVKENLSLIYSCYKDNYDIYSAFMQLAFQLNKPNGIWGYIIPVSWQSGEKYLNFRQYLVSNGKLEIGIKLPYDVFEDAYVDTGIYIIRNVKSSSYSSLVFEFPAKFKYYGDLITDINLKVLPFEYWSNLESRKIVLNPSFYELLPKVFKNTIPLDNITNSIRGILPSFEDVSDIQNPDDKKYFVGGLYRYEIIRDFKGVNYGDHLKEKPKDYSFFQGERILIRRLINRQFQIMAMYLNDEFVNKKDLYNLKVINDEFDIKFLLALINSKLISYLKIKGTTTATKDDFGQLTLSDIRQIPIKKIEKELQVPFTEKSDTILSVNKELQEQSQKFQRNLQREFHLENLPKKLQDWYLLSYADFIKELEKQKVKLSLSQKAEWEDYFTTEAKKVLELQNQIDLTDKAIDRMVYELYGLSEEEIEIVESSN